LLALLFLALLLGTACAHDPDTSYARIRIQPDRLELRLTLDVFTLQLIVPKLDANADRALSRAELAAGLAAAREFFTAHVALQIDSRPAPLGEPGEPFWPLDATDPLPAEKWHDTTALISFPFDTKLSTRPKSVSLGFAVFDRLGDRHTILGTFEAGSEPKQVIFNIAEPDYLFTIAPLATAPPASTPPQRPFPASPPPAAAWTSPREVGRMFPFFCFLPLLYVAFRLLRRRGRR
jgi:hypothetical protein